MHPSQELELRYGARNYDPLPVVLTRGEGVYVWDDTGKRYHDMMGAYSAVSHGHCHPKLVQALRDQAGRLAIVSRAFYSDLHFINLLLGEAGRADPGQGPGRRITAGFPLFGAQ